MVHESAVWCIGLQKKPSTHYICTVGLQKEYPENPNSKRVGAKKIIMARHTWFTDPSENHGDNRFSSFYLYDDSTRNFVRIRLDMNRPDGHRPCIVIRSNRVVGFSRKQVKVSVKENGIFTENNQLLSNIPQVGYWVYDGTPGRNAHHGHQITDNPYLPDDITKDMLLKLAERFIGLEDNTIRIDANNPGELRDYLSGMQM